MTSMPPPTATPEQVRDAKEAVSRAIESLQNLLEALNRAVGDEELVSVPLTAVEREALENYTGIAIGPWPPVHPDLMAV